MADRALEFHPAAVAEARAAVETMPVTVLDWSRHAVHIAPRPGGGHDVTSTLLERPPRRSCEDLGDMAWISGNEWQASE